MIRANQFFTKDLFLRLFFQTNTAIDRQNLQAVFVWRYRPPFGTVQVAYQRGTAEFGERSNQGHTVFLKTTPCSDPAMGQWGSGQWGDSRASRRASARTE